MTDESVITWEQVRLQARQNLKAWAENRGKQMPLYRRRESVTAEEVIAKIGTVKWTEPTAALIAKAAVEMIECTINEICGKNGIENENAPRR